MSSARRASTHAAASAEDDRTARSRTAASGRREETTMSAKKTTKKNAPAKARKARKDDSPVVSVRPFDVRGVPLEPKKAKKAPAEKAAPKEKTPREDLMVFAFRLTRKEGALIHKAAGPGKASRFVRSLAVAAARNDEAAVKDIMTATKSEA